ncbi:hypothetical protein BsWGS_09295 [Bradybaena similaris]
MNAYTFRGWHLPTSYPDSTGCDRNYSSVYPPPWPSGYFTSAPVYPFQADDSSVKPTNTSQWKLSGLGSPEGSYMSRDSNVRMVGYESLFYKNSANRAERETCSKDDQRSCCAVSCPCSNHQNVNSNDSSWRSCEMSAAAFDFNISSGLSSYQNFCHIDMQQSIHLPSSVIPTTTVTLKKRRRPYSKLQIAELEREYSSSTYISKSRRWELSQLINLSERQIKIWFQNRRIKAKKIQKRDVATPYSPPIAVAGSTHGPPLSHVLQTAISVP